MSGKLFQTLRAKAALAGIILMRTHPADGPVQLLAAFGSRVQLLRSIDDLEGLAARLGGGG